MNPEEDPLPPARPLRDFRRAVRCMLIFDAIYGVIYIYLLGSHTDMPQPIREIVERILLVATAVAGIFYFVGRVQLRSEDRLRADIVMAQAQTEGRAFAEISRLRHEVVQLRDELGVMHREMLDAMARIAGGIRGNSHRLEQVADRLDDVDESTGGIVVATGRVVEQSDRDRDLQVAGLHDRVERMSETVHELGADITRRFEAARNEAKASGYAEGYVDGAARRQEHDET